MARNSGLRLKQRKMKYEFESNMTDDKRKDDYISVFMVCSCVNDEERCIEHSEEMITCILANN